MSDPWPQSEGPAPWEPVDPDDNSYWTKDRFGEIYDENKEPKIEWKQEVICRNCDSREHFIRNCPESPTNKSPSTRVSFFAGNIGDANAESPKAESAKTERPKVESPKAESPKVESHGPLQSSGPSGSSGACFNCGEEGHMKADCPNARKPGSCYNCGEEGHIKAECPKPRVFKGTCRLCLQEGHPYALCPEKPPDFCRNCKAEGHQSKDCTANRKFDLNNVADKLPEEAWAAMKEASDEKDINDFREALKVYSKALPSATYVEIEKKMREENFKIYLIALEKQAEDVISLIDLQGQLDRQYVVGFYFSSKPLRANLSERWPADEADNMERLANAGQPYDRQVMKCRNCGELGHTSRGCKQERTESERVEIKCSNCGGLGHRVRDCKEKRKNKFGCRNCGAEDHDAKDCPEPRSAADVECRRCNEMGHFAKECPNAPERAPRTCRNCGSEDHIARDCDQPRDPSTMTCRNCDKVGHAARDCPEPKDWSRVKCNRCGEMGHTVRRCPQPEDWTPTKDNDFAEQSTDNAGWGADPDQAVDEIERGLAGQLW